MQHSDLLPLAITPGDCAGVGPELILRCLSSLRAGGPVVAYGQRAVYEAALASLRTAASSPAAPSSAAPSPAAPSSAAPSPAAPASSAPASSASPPPSLPSAVVSVASPGEAAACPSDVLPVIEVPTSLSPGSLTPYPWGAPVAAFGELQHAALRRAIDDAMAGEVCAILTAPWHKARLVDAGLPPTGHTEVLEHATASPRAVMVLAGEVLRVALATTHLPLRAVADALDEDDLVRVATLFDDGLRRLWGIPDPVIALTGLNPHAGEGGVMGDEDVRVIAPAVARLVAAGVRAVGPAPADTLFPLVANGIQRADGVLAMYHDQGLAPLKTFHFGAAANITLGLPIIRTSVDHGTAYDIAGTGRVRAGSFLYAAALARRFAANARAASAAALAASGAPPA